MTDKLVIARRFCGPPDSGNGGYACGRFAAYLDGPAEVTLRQPPPLETPMAIEHAADGLVHVLDGDTLIAEARCAPHSMPVPVPDPVSVADARSAGARSLFRTEPGAHPFPTCFVCGPDRHPGDGLRIQVGPVSGRSLSADIWVPDAALVGADGYVRPEFLWAALDCAGGVGALTEAAPSDLAFVLGRLTVWQLGPVQPGEPYVVTGWRISEKTRKLTAGSAVFDADWRPVGIACATWIQLRADAAIMSVATA